MVQVVSQRILRYADVPQLVSRVILRYARMRMCFNAVRRSQWVRVLAEAEVQLLGGVLL